MKSHFVRLLEKGDDIIQLSSILKQSSGIDSQVRRRTAIDKQINLGKDLIKGFRGHSRITGGQ